MGVPVLCPQLSEGSAPTPEPSLSLTNLGDAFVSVHWWQRCNQAQCCNCRYRLPQLDERAACAQEGWTSLWPMKRVFDVVRSVSSGK